MNRDDFGTSWKSSDILMSGACPKDCRALRQPAAILVAGRDGPKDSLTRREVEDFLLLAPGERVVVLDQETGELWRGSVDAPFPQFGLVWVFTDLGERKLFDVALHTVWRAALRRDCGRQR